MQSIHNNSKVIKKCRELEASAFDLGPPPHSLPTSPTSPTLSAFEGGKRHDVSVNRGSNVKQLLVGITRVFFLSALNRLNILVLLFLLIFLVLCKPHTLQESHHNIMATVQQLFSLEGQTALVTGGTRGKFRRLRLNVVSVTNCCL